MKKLYLILALLLILATDGLTFGPAIQAVIGSSVTPATYYCNTCPDGSNGADVFCEDCHAGASTGVCEWTKDESGGATGTIVFDATPDNSPALGCTGIGMTYAIQALKTNATSGIAYAYKDFTATDLYIQFYIKIVAEGLADNDTWQILSLTGEGPIAFFRLIQLSGDLRFNLLWYDTGWVQDNGGTNLALDTWYGVRIYYHNPAGTSGDTIRWWIDYPNNGTWTDEGDNGATGGFTYVATRLLIGSVGSTTKTISYYITGLKVDDDTMPTACGR
jgi:hypothetical protein